MHSDADTSVGWTVPLQFLLLAVGHYRPLAWNREYISVCNAWQVSCAALTRKGAYSEPS